MSEPVRSTRAAMLLRSFSVQATWNYRTLMGAGFAYVMLPVLRELYGRDRDRLRDAIARHSGVFNCHPYLVGIAAGAVARLEADGADPRLIDRFKAAVRGSLGSLGDQLIWAGWRPVCALLALLLLLVGMPWWVVCGAFLIAYNAGHVAARIYSFRLGWAHGMGVAEKLRQPWVAEVQRRIATTGAFLLGVLVPLAAGGRTLALPHPAIAAAVAAVGLLLGLRFGSAVRTPVVLVLVVFVLVGLFVRWWS
ncbi:MAG TPA: PTS system mannose/fructose/sorbose family transporter subunit IID [Longimicrobiales bacterium]|nr:PTS system mannose/fructose/sorbose family transporter subunit IID [Longimicrobiales bacterium]